MDYVARPTPWYPGYDRMHPLATGLVNCYPMWEGSGHGIMDVVGGDHGRLKTDGGTYPSWEGSRGGGGLQFDGDGSGEYVEVPDSPNLRRPSTELTVLVVGQIGSKASGNFAGMVYKGWGSTTPFMSWSFSQRLLLENQLQFYKANGSAFTATPILDSIPLDTDLLICGRFGGILGSNELRLNIYNLETGLELANSPQSASNSGAIGYTSDSLVMGTDRVATGPKKSQRLEMVSIYDKSLAMTDSSGGPSQLLRWLLADPFAVLRRRQPIVMPSIAASGGALVRLIGETQQVSESLIERLSMTRVVNDFESIADGTVRSLSLVRLVDETTSIAEGTLVTRAIRRVVDETETVTEAASRLLAMSIIIDETEGVSDATVEQLGLVRVLDESESIAEAVSRLGNLFRVLDESEVVNESVLPTRALTRLVAETESIAEATPIVARALTRVLDESQTIAEAAAGIRGLIKFVNGTEMIAEAAPLSILATPSAGVRSVVGGVFSPVPVLGVVGQVTA